MEFALIQVLIVTNELPVVSLADRETDRQYLLKHDGNKSLTLTLRQEAQKNCCIDC